MKPPQSQDVFAMSTKADDVSEAAVCTTSTAASEAVGLATQAAIGPFIQACKGRFPFKLFPCTCVF